MGYGAAEAGQIICLRTRLGFVSNERACINLKERDMIFSEAFYEVLFPMMYTFKFVEFSMGRTHSQSKTHSIRKASVLFAFQVCVEVPLEVLRRVVKANLFVDFLDLLDILGRELEITLEVGLDAALGF